MGHPSWIDHSPFLVFVLLSPVTFFVTVSLFAIHFFRTKRPTDGAIDSNHIGDNSSAEGEREAFIANGEAGDYSLSLPKVRFFPSDLEIWATSLELTLNKSEYWRTVTSAVSHVGWIHLLLNTVYLMETGEIERRYGSGMYLRLTVTLWLFSTLTDLGLVAVYRKISHSQYDGRAVGYSGVLFAFMAYNATYYKPGTMVSIFGLTIPAIFSPFVNLLITSIIVRNASFRGHLAGILAGFAAGFGLLFFTIESTFLTLSIILWTSILFVLSLKARYPGSFRFVEFTSPSSLSSHYSVDDSIV